MSETTTKTTETDNATEDISTDSDTETGDIATDGINPESGTNEPDTFPRSYVEQLRQENGRYRQRAQQGDQYAQRLHTELVRATGRLADPTDVPFAVEHLEDGDKLSLAIDDLLTRKPHLANRRPMGDIGQGASSRDSANVDLAAILRQRAQ